MDLPGWYPTGVASLPVVYAGPTEAKENMARRQAVRAAAGAALSVSTPGVMRTDPITDEEVNYLKYMEDGGLALAGYGPSHFFGDLTNKIGHGLGDAASTFTLGLAEVGHTLGNFMGDLGNFGSKAAQGIGGTMRNVTYMLTAGVIVGGVLYVRNQSK